MCLASVGDFGTPWERVVRGDDGAGFPHLGRIVCSFPAMLADLFGPRHAASNYSFLYSTKGVASILGGGLAAALFERTGTWDYAFYGSAGLALCAAFGALGLLKMPLPKKKHLRLAEEQIATGMGAARAPDAP